MSNYLVASFIIKKQLYSKKFAGLIMFLYKNFLSLFQLRTNNITIQSHTIHNK